MKKISSIISYLLHPLLMPLYCMVLVFSNANYLSFSVKPKLQLFIYGMVFISTFLMPVLSTLFILYRGEITSLKLPNKEERTLPFFFTACYYIMCYYLMCQLPIPYFLNVIILGAAITIILAITINLKWKISIHMIGIGGAVGLMFALSHLLFADYNLAIIITVFIAGVLGTTRMHITDHSPLQVYAGFLLGVFVEYVSLYALT